ncbi:nitroreductase family protein [candidate division KSB1 bacterium]|nr:nitroreductase family protein [candidate division KSB1 bacterium]
MIKLISRLYIVYTALCLHLLAQELATIKLNPPDTQRGLPFMQTLAVKASATEWSEQELSLQDLSDLLWAANGLNRPEENKTTASSAMNSHDVDMISDADRFRAGSPELRYEWGALDAGIISQNISLFCAATGLKTRPRASMDKEKITELLKLNESQHVFLEHPVGYAK